jgi:hypothetical protein
MAYYQENTKGFGFGGILTFVSGVVVGLLFASKPGSETRQQIADLVNRGKGKEALRRGQETMQRAREAITGESGYQS